VQWGCELEEDERTTFTGLSYPIFAVSWYPGLSARLCPSPCSSLVYFFNQNGCYFAKEDFLPQHHVPAVQKENNVEMYGGESDQTAALNFDSFEDVDLVHEVSGRGD
jgi:hypothetical protein